MAMRTDDTTWNAVVAETEARIGRLNKKAAKRGMEEHFAAHVHRSQDRTILLTEHYLGLLVERKAIARDARTGELRKVRPKKIAGKIDFAIGVAPKAWNKLEGKPAHEIVRTICLASYIMLTWRKKLLAA
jgi:hypothetical protein